MHFLLSNYLQKRRLEDSQGGKGVARQKSLIPI